MRHVTSVYASVYHLRHACMLVALVHIHLLRDGATGSRRGVDLEVISRHAPVEVPRNLMVCSITCRGIQLLGRVEARGFPGADGSEIVDRSSPSPSLSPSSLMPPVPATCPLPHACNDCPFPIPTPSLHAQPSCTKRTRWLATLAGSPQNAGLRRLPGRLLYGHLVPFHHAHSPGRTPFSAPFGGMNCVARRRERYDL